MKEGKHSCMTAERVELLEKLGFVWSTTSGAGNSNSSNGNSITPPPSMSNSSLHQNPLPYLPIIQMNGDHIHQDANGNNVHDHPLLQNESRDAKKEGFMPIYDSQDRTSIYAGVHSSALHGLNPYPQQSSYNFDEGSSLSMMPPHHHAPQHPFAGYYYTSSYQPQHLHFNPNPYGQLSGEGPGNGLLQNPPPPTQQQHLHEDGSDVNDSRRADGTNNVVPS